MAAHRHADGRVRRASEEVALRAEPTAPDLVENESTTVTGRVLGRAGRAGPLLLVRGETRLELHLPAHMCSAAGSNTPLVAPPAPGRTASSKAELPRAGDLARMRVTSRRGRLEIDDWEVLTLYRGDRPFPSPGGEYYRLRGGPRPRAANIVRRAAALQGLRAFFDRRGYIEVQPPHRVHCPGLEPHLSAIPSGERYLITSPEYHMKRLLAGGMERIYFLGPCWRGDELGPHHIEELCMLEWYRAYASLEDLMEETEELLREMGRSICGSTRLSYQGAVIDLEPRFARLTVAEAFSRHAGIELAGLADTAELARRAVAAGFGPFASDDPFEAVVSRVLVERVEPALAHSSSPVFLHDFPAPLAALARLRPDDPTVAERFELYTGGLELANAFAELTDPDEQERRLRADQLARARAGQPAHLLDERFLAALREGMPPAAGIALGVDRLLMLLCDAGHIREVVAFAPEEI